MRSGETLLPGSMGGSTQEWSISVWQLCLGIKRKFSRGSSYGRHAGDHISPGAPKKSAENRAACAFVIVVRGSTSDTAAGIILPKSRPVMPSTLSFHNFFSNPADRTAGMAGAAACSASSADRKNSAKRIKTAAAPAAGQAHILPHM